MTIAKVVASRSSCNSRHVGCVLVRDNQIISTGYNGAISGHEHCSDHGKKYCARRNHGASKDLQAHYCVASHAEANAIAYADRDRMGGCDCYVTLEPCNACLKLLLQAGVVRVYYELEYDGRVTQMREDLTHSFERYERIAVDAYSYSEFIGTLTFSSSRLLEATE